MNTKGIKFLAVLAVLAMAFAVFAVVSDSDAENEAPAASTEPADVDKITYQSFVDGNGKVTLQKDSIVEQTIKFAAAGNYVIDLNGYKLTAGSSVGNIFVIVADNTSLRIIANEGSITAGTATTEDIDHGTVVRNDKTENSSVEIIGGTYTGEYVFLDYAKPGQTQASGSFKISNATINASVAGIWFGNGKTANVSIDNTKVVSKDIGIYLGTIGTAKLTNVDVKSVGTSLEIKSGTVTVNGGSYASEKYVPASKNMNGNGSGDGEDTICINNAYAKINASSDVNVVFQNDVKITNTKTGAPVEVVAGYYGDSTDAAPQKITVNGLEASLMDIVDVNIKAAVPAAGDTPASEAVPSIIKIVPPGKSAIIPTKTIPGATDVINSDTYLIIDAEQTAFSATLKEGVSITVKAGAAVTGTIKFGTAANDQKVDFTNVKGIATFSKGSVIVKSGSIESGTITLQDGDELKLSGAILGNLTITTAANAKAKVIIEEGTEFNTVDKELIINSAGITVDIYGKVAGKMTLTAVDKVNAYAQSDINYLATDYTKVNGISDNGTWSYDGTLTLNGYNGNYNFLKINDKPVIVAGDVVLSYAPEKNISAFFNGVEISTLQDPGSLTINVDISDLVYEDRISMDVVKASSIDTVGVNIDVSGIPDWTDEQIKALKVTGLTVSGNMYKAPTTVDVLFDEEIASTTGAVFSSGLTNCNAVSVKASQNGVTIKGAVKDTQIVAEAGNVAAIIGAEQGTTKFSSDSTVTSAGIVKVIGTVELSQGAAFDVADLILFGTISNYGTIKTNGDSLILAGATLKNYSVFENTGIVGVLGNIENTGVTDGSVVGRITNDGSILYSANFGTSGSFTITDAIDIEKESKNAKIKSIAITIPAINAIYEKEGIINVEGYKALVSGSVPVKATVAFSYDETKYTWTATEFEGTLTNTYTGYILDITDGTANINLAFDKTADDAQIGSQYAEDVSGYIKATVKETATATEGTTPAATPATPKTENLALIANKDKVAPTADTIKDVYSTKNAKFTLSKGTVQNNGVFIVETSTAVDIVKDTEFNGPLTVYGANVTVNGVMNGELTTDKDVTVNNQMNGDILSADKVTISGTADLKATMTGNIVATGVTMNKYSELTGNIVAGATGVNLAGKVTGDILSAGPVTLVTFSGNITMTGDNTVFTATGVVDASVTYASEYISAKATKDGEEDTKTEFAVTFDVKTALEEKKTAAAVSVSLTMVKGNDATATEAGAPGYIEFVSTTGANAATDATATITVTAGALKAAAADFKMPLGFEVIIEAAAELEVAIAYDIIVEDGALKVSTDAVRNYEVNVIGAPEEFGEVKYIMSFDLDGYTIYSDIAYAVSNCAPNTELVVGQSAAVKSDISVKEGVNIIVGEDIVLTFNAGVSAEMAEGAQFTLVKNGQIVFTATGDLLESISATIEYDENIIKFENAFFKANATVKGVEPFIDTDVPMVYADIDYYGKATVVAGVATGKFVLNAKVEQIPANADASNTEAPKTTPANMFAELVIADGAEITQATITDVAPVVADKVTFSTIVTVDGVLTTGNLDINGTYNGAGVIAIADAMAVNVKSTADVNGKFTVGEESGFVLADVKKSALTISSKMTGTAYAAELSAAKTADTAAAAGFVAGTIEAIGDANLNNVYIDKDATIVADKAIIVANSEAQGKLKTKELVESETAKLTYDATYADGDYTVYTHFLNIDQTEVTDITVDGEKFGANITAAADLKEVDIAGINLTIKDKTALTITKPMVIGTPRTSLGEGTVITGKIIIGAGTDTQPVYVIVYDGADVTSAEFKASTGTDDAAKSAFDIEGTHYADVYANSSLKLNVPADYMKPEIKGYVFTKWSTYNGEELKNAAVGTTDVTATLVAGKVTVTLKEVAGVAYYINNVQQATDVPLKIDVESIITLKVTDTSKYENPTINGKVSYVVTGDDDGTTLEATVNEKKAPSNDDDDDDGLGLTEILLIVLVVLIAVMCVILILRFNRS